MDGFQVDVSYILFITFLTPCFTVLYVKILEHFGAVDGDLERAPLNFDKLDQRLAKRDAHSKSGMERSMV